MESSTEPLKTLGAYVLHERIGAGGMGVVYRAIDRRTGSTVAVKVIHEHLQNDDYIARFRSEAHLASLLASPYIVRVLEFGVDKGQYFLATEFVEGSTIAALMSRDRLTTEQSLSIATGVAMALQSAASQGIVHRDIKPDNILHASDSSIKLMDFGVARLSYVETQAHFLGTVSYAAPEQFKGISTTQSDIYSLGVVLFQMLAGELPFKAGTLASLMRMHEETPPPLERMRAPQEIRNVVGRCLAKDPSERYANPSELLAALQIVRRSLSEPALVGSPRGTKAGDDNHAFEQPDTQLGETQTHRSSSDAETVLPASPVEKAVAPSTTPAPREARRSGSTKLAAVGAFAVGVVVIAGMFFAFQGKTTPRAAASTLDDAFKAALEEFDVEACPPAGHLFKETCITSEENAQSNADPATGIAALGMGNNFSGSILFMARDSGNHWRPWFETQNQPYDLIRLPGDLRVCSLDGPVAVRSKASEKSRIVSTFKSGDILRADSFVLTRPLPRGTGNDFRTKGEGWYKVSSPAAGWVHSLKVSDAEVKDCEIHDLLEREFSPAALRAATSTPIATSTATATAIPTATSVPPTPTPPPPPPAAVAPAGIHIGSNVVVTNTGNCLRLRETPTMNGKQVSCLLDNATAKVVEGPVDSAGVHWWRIQGKAGGKDFSAWAAEYNQSGVVWLLER